MFTSRLWVRYKRRARASADRSSAISYNMSAVRLRIVVCCGLCPVLIHPIAGPGPSPCGVVGTSHDDT